MTEAEDALAEEFWAVSRTLRALAREALSAWDVTPSQARALAVLRRGAGGHSTGVQVSAGPHAADDGSAGHGPVGHGAAGRGHPARLRELAERLRIAPRSATEVVDGLEERGLVERKPDPADRRATLVALTAHGEDVAAGIRAARASGAGSVFARLPAPDRAELARLLDALRAAATHNLA